MKKIWSICLIGLVLTWLLALGPLPAGAYYPPVEAKAVYDTNTVTITVIDPEDGGHQSTGAYGEEYAIIDLKQQNGVIAWITKYNVGPVYEVSYTVYDPYRKTFKNGGQGNFTKVTGLTVIDGVVAFVANDSEFKYTTYDPVKGDWQNRSYLPTFGDTVHDLEVTTKDGVVLLFFKWEIVSLNLTSSTLLADIYDAALGKWYSETKPWGLEIVFDDQEPVVLKQYTINNATIHTTWGPDYTSQFDNKDILGYDASKQNWHKNAYTKPTSHFAAQPYYGPSPLWVFFTDLSIGAASIEWSFGDGSPTETKRSTYHKYTNDGEYLSGQKITAPSTSARYQKIYVGIEPPTWFSSYTSMASADDLTMLRRYRDEVLSKDPQGKVYKERLYANSDAALTVLTDNPELLARAKNLIDTNMGAVIQVLQGHEEGIIYDAEDVLAFLETYEELAPPQLKALINVVRKEMRQSQREGKPFLGFKLGSDKQNKLPKPPKSDPECT